MAPTSPRTTYSRRSTTLANSAMLADVVSWGYAATVMLAALVFDMQFQPWQAGVMGVLFLLLRAVATEIRRDARRAALSTARHHAKRAAASPRRWSVEQRDGLGRRVDAGA